MAFSHDTLFSPPLSSFSHGNMFHPYLLYFLPSDGMVWCGMVWCLFIQHQCTLYIAQITQDAEREMHEV